MMNQRICAFAVSMLVPAAIVAACAKRTVTVDVSAPPRAAAPAPPRSGGAAATESPVTPLTEVTTRPGTASPGTTSPGTSSPGAASPGTSEPRTPLGSARPAPAEFAGIRPVEILGDTVFPPIGAAPYFVSVGPHGFYWFRLERPGDADEPYGIESTAI